MDLTLPSTADGYICLCAGYGNIPANRVLRIRFMIVSASANIELAAYLNAGITTIDSYGNGAYEICYVTGGTEHGFGFFSPNASSVTASICYFTCEIVN